VLNVIERHDRDAAIRRFLQEKTPHRFGHSKQRRERHPNRALIYVRAGQSFRVDIGRRLFIEPQIIQGLALE
jgi:hypothetical protein